MIMRLKRFRFSIGFVLVLTVVAALVARFEVPRANAVRETMALTKKSHGACRLKPRFYLPPSLAKRLPANWANYIEGAGIGGYVAEVLPGVPTAGPFAPIVSREEVLRVIQMGGLRHATELGLIGTACDDEVLAVVGQYCHPTKLTLIDTAVSKGAIERFRLEHPDCQVQYICRYLAHPPEDGREVTAHFHGANYGPETPLLIPLLPEPNA